MGSAPMKPENVSVIDNFIEEGQRMAQEIARLRRRLSEEEYNAKVLREERAKLFAEQSALRERLAEVERERDSLKGDVANAVAVAHEEQGNSIRLERERDEARAAMRKVERECMALLTDRDTAREALRVARDALEGVREDAALRVGDYVWTDTDEDRKRRVAWEMTVARLDAALASTKGDVEPHRCRSCRGQLSVPELCVDCATKGDE